MKVKTRMMHAVDISLIDWKKYGILYDLTGAGSTENTNASEGEGWKDIDSNCPILDTLGALGMTTSVGTPFICEEMERHRHTQEAQIPAGTPIVLCVSDSLSDSPEVESIRPILIKPGYVFVLHRSIWHSASHCVGDKGSYYWMAQVYYNEPTEWVHVAGGPILVEL